MTKLGIPGKPIEEGEDQDTGEVNTRMIVLIHLVYLQVLISQLRIPSIVTSVRLHKGQGGLATSRVLIVHLYHLQKN